MTKLNVYLHFKGNCREAMNYYKDVFGGKLDLQTVGESPMPDQSPEMKDQIMHSTLSSDDVMIMASDMMDSDQTMAANRVSLCVVADGEAVKNMFEKLSEGGKVGHPLKEEFFGTYGDLTDKFGINWMFMYGMDKK